MTEYFQEPRLAVPWVSEEALQASNNRGIASPELMPIISLLFSELMCPQEPDPHSFLYRQKQYRG